jgi:beta-lactamase regulating signal transducer with metallopeptidase domain
MQPLFHSTFLQALGFAIANSLWQSALLWLAYALVSQVLPLSAAKKYRLAVAAQLLSFVWFAITIQFYYSQYTAALGLAGAAGDPHSLQAIVAGNNSFSSQLVRYMAGIEKLLPFVSMAYLLLMLVLFVRWIASYRQTQQIRNDGLEKIHIDWRLFVRKITAQLGIKKEVLVYLSKTAATPLTIGFWKPVILVPIASINHLSTAQLEAVLLHELAHVKRNDYLVNIILSTVEIALFFNPFTQLISRTIRKERENCCDDWVLQYQYEASDYAQALLRIASLQHKPAFAMAAAADKTELLTRVKRMIGQQENRFNYRRQLLAFLLVTGMLCSIAWLNPVVSPAQKPQAAKAIPPKKVFIQPAASQASTVPDDKSILNPVLFLSTPMKAVMQQQIAAAQQELNSLVADNAATGDLQALQKESLRYAADALAKTADSHLIEKSLEQAKMGMAKLFSDSLGLSAAVRKQMAEDMRKSMSTMGSEFEKAAKEIARVSENTKSLMLDREKISRDIEHAMDEMKKLDFEKLDKLPGMPALIDRGKRERKRPVSDVPPVENPQMKITVSLPEQLDMPDIAEPAIKLVKAAQRQVVLTPQMVAELTLLASILDQAAQEDISPETEKRIRLKLNFIHRMLDKKPVLKLRAAKFEEKINSEKASLADWNDQ